VDECGRACGRPGAGRLAAARGGRPSDPRPRQRGSPPGKPIPLQHQVPGATVRCYESCGLKYDSLTKFSIFFCVNHSLNLYICAAVMVFIGKFFLVRLESNLTFPLHLRKRV
jgi:hypothetical protein